MKSSSNVSFGFEERSRKRKIALDRVKARVDALIEEHISPVFKNKSSTLVPEPEPVFQELIGKLQTQYVKFKQYRIARNYLARRINEGNKEGMWSLPVPSYIHRYQRESLLRNEKWFKRTKLLNEWNQQWLGKLANTPAIELKDTSCFLLGSCLVSAVIYGGLCIPDAVKCLTSMLINEAKPLKKSKYGLYVELVFESKSFSHNIIDKERSKTLRRWYPDPFTLIWINSFLSASKVKPLEDKSENEWGLISLVLQSVDISIIKDISSLVAFCSAGLGVLENLDSVNLSQADVGYIRGDNKSVSLPTEVYEMSISSCFKKATASSDRKYVQSTNSKTQYKFNSNSSFSAERFISDIRLALTKKDEYGRKRRVTEAIEQLKEISKEYSNSSTELMTAWLLDLFNQNLKISTVSRYWSAIGNAWLAFSMTINLVDLDSAGFDSMYKNILDSSNSEKNRHYMAARLDQFHYFLHSCYEFPSLPAPLSENFDKKQSFVRAYYLPQKALLEVLEGLEIAIDDKALKQSLEVLIIVAIRSGMRIGELIKLRINDIENSHEGWIFVRNNQFGDGKTSTALRKLPLNVLLLGNEKHIVQAYFLKRRNIASGENILVFSEANALNVPLNGNSVASIFANLAKSVTGVHSTFHGLRHTALSNLHLIIEDEEGLLRGLVGYEPIQLRNIKESLGYTRGNAFHRDKYWSIASFAGHSSPDITFGSYLHFTDYLVSRSVHRSFKSISQRAIKAASGLSVNILTRIAKISSSDYEWYEHVRSRIESQLKSVTTVVSQSSKYIDSGIQSQISAKQKTNVIGVDVCYSVLKDAEDKMQIFEIADKYVIEQKIIESWILNARDLAERLTTKEVSRLFSKGKRKAQAAVNLAPTKPATRAELIEADEAIGKVRKLYKDRKDELAWCIFYFIENTNRSKPHILFKDPKMLNDFLGFMFVLFPPERWELKVFFLTGFTDNTEDTWLKLPNVQKVKPSKYYKENKRNTGSSAHLRLKHPKERSIVESTKFKTYSARTLGYVFHMVAIMAIVQR